MSHLDDTLIPFWQYIKWLGLDGWRVAGVNRNPVSPSNFNNKISRGDNCDCLLEFDTNHASRHELRESLKKAEEFFITEANLFPAPKQILEEQHQIKNGWRINPLKQTTYGNIKSFRPFYPCEVREFGLFKLNFSETVNVVKLDGEGEILDTMSITFEVSEDIELSQIRLYFSEEECIHCGYQTQRNNEEWDYNFHLCEVRPFCDMSVSEGSGEGLKQVTITFFSYIIVKPSLASSEVCLENIEENYVDTLDIYIEEKVVCEDGYFLCHEGGCGSVPCSTEEMQLCISDKIIYREKWFVPRPLSCELVDEECICEETCPPCNPERVVINYLTGKKLNYDRTVDWNCLEIIAKLALFLQDCHKDWCKCETCITKKIEHYNQVPKEVVRVGNEAHSYGDEYQLLLSKFTLAYADGLLPSRGLVEAMRAISNIRCKYSEGVYVG